MSAYFSKRILLLKLLIIIKKIKKIIDSWYPNLGPKAKPVGNC